MKKGISLVALIITIIVLIILTASVIMLAGGENGIIQRAKNAIDANNIVAFKEKIILEMVDLRIDASMKNISVADYMQANNIEFSDKDVEYIVDPQSKNITFTIDDLIAITDEDGNILECDKYNPVLPEGWNKDRLSVANPIVTQGERSAPIPRGFKVSSNPNEQSIENGLVITDSISEFVWIPVDDPKTTRGYSACISCGEDGILPDSTTCPRCIEIDGFFRMKIGKLYVANQYTQGENFSLNPTTFEYAYDGMREPGLVSTYSHGYYDQSLGNDLDGSQTYLTVPGVLDNETKNAFNFLIQMNDEFLKMTTSLETYKGFYMGRYETSLNGGIAQSKKMQTSMTNVNWYESYAKQREAYKNNLNVSSGMVWGCLWDQVILAINAKGINITNCSTWGNYQDNAETGAGTKQVTGFNDTWKALNIYDMAGNLREWSMEADSNSYRIVRGGDYTDNGSEFRITRRSDQFPNDITDTDGITTGNITSRMHLYIKE